MKQRSNAHTASGALKVVRLRDQASLFGKKRGEDDSVQIQSFGSTSVTSGVWPAIKETVAVSIIGSHCLGVESIKSRSLLF
jgi:hypothetical protein